MSYGRGFFLLFFSTLLCFPGVRSMPPTNSQGNLPLSIVNSVSFSREDQETAQIPEIALQRLKDEYFRFNSNHVDDFSSTNVDILHNPSLVFLTVKNHQNLTSLNIYEPDNTNLQFHPCNHTEITVTPGEILQTSPVNFSIQARGCATESPFSMPLNVLDTKLEISCVNLGSRSQNYGNVDHVLPPLGMKATNMIQSDEPVRSEETNNKMSVLTGKELKFGIVHINTHQSRYIQVINPSNQGVFMELLIFEQDLIIECQNSDKILYPPTFLNSQITPPTYGFSIPGRAATKAYVRPHGKAVLGPVFFHPSNRCAWTSQVYILNDVSNAEWMFLRASGGLPVLVLFNGSDPVDTVKLKYPEFGQRSVQVLFAKNTGELPVEVKSISVMGAKCEWDGFVVNDCNGFRLLPGEQRKLEISFRADFCKGMVRSEIHMVTSGGIMVVPVEVGLSTPKLKICERFFWTRVKQLILAVIVSIFLIFMASSCMVSFLIRKGNLPKMSSGQEQCSSDVCPNPEPAKTQPSSLPVCPKSLRVKKQPSSLVRPKPKTRKIRQSLMYSSSKLPETAKEVAVVETEKPEKQGTGPSSVSSGRLDASSSSSHIRNSTPSSPLSRPSSLTLELSPSQPSAQAESPRPHVVDLTDPRYEYSIWDDHLRVVPNLPEGSFFAFFGYVNNTNENN